MQPSAIQLTLVSFPRRRRSAKSAPSEKGEEKPGRLMRRSLDALRRFCRLVGPEFRPWKGQWRLFVLALLSAAALRLGYPRWDWAVAGAFALVPFLWALGRATSGKQAFYIGWLFGAAFYYVLMIWLNVLVKYHFLIPAAVVSLSVYLGLFKGLFAWVVWRARRRGQPVFLVAAAAWVAVEYLQSLGDLGFPWGYLGHSLWHYPSLIQLAAWTGVYGLSLVLFWVNDLVCDGIGLLRREPGAPPTGQMLARIALLAVFALAVGLAARDGRRRVSSEGFYATPPVRVGIVQPNIPQEVKVLSYGPDTPDNEQQRLQNDILRKTIALSLQLQPKPEAAERCDLILWPETAVTDDWMAYQPAYATLFNDLATTRLGASLFFGASNVRLHRNGRYIPVQDLDASDFQINFDDYTLEIYVSAWFAEPGRGYSPRIYNKRRLVPFAEGIPYVQRVEPLKRLIMAIGQMQPFDRGKGPVVFDLRARAGDDVLLRFGPLICYESCYPDLSRSLVRHGAEMLVIITNDAWYEMTAGPRQHQLEAVFRAVETRRWVARCANHGISCFVSPLGEVVSETELGRDATLKHAVRGVKELTFYSRCGDLFAALALIVTVGMLLTGKRRQ